MPEGAIYVGRPSLWGNRYVVGQRPHPDHIGGGVTPCDCPVVADRQAAVDLYRADVWLTTGGEVVRRDRFEPLRGHDLACWCPLCEAHRDGLPLGVVCPDCAPCHADVLLELANRA